MGLRNVDFGNEFPRDDASPLDNTCLWSDIPLLGGKFPLFPLDEASLPNNGVALPDDALSSTSCKSFSQSIGGLLFI
jgi:hypothetical protein